MFKKQKRIEYFLHYSHESISSQFKTIPGLFNSVVIVCSIFDADLQINFNICYPIDTGRDRIFTYYANWRYTSS